MKGKRRRPGRLPKHRPNMAPGASTVPEASNTAGDAIRISNTSAAAGSALEDAIARFTARNRHSLEIHAQALESMPDGNTRAQMYTYPFPVCMKSGKGYRVTSEDGHTYVHICYSAQPVL